MGLRLLQRNHRDSILWVPFAGLIAGCLALLAALTGVAAPPQQKELPRLHEIFEGDFQIGVSLAHDDLHSAKNQELLTHFNAITAEDDMKWERLQPTEGNFTFEAADALLASAQRDQRRFTGHTLVWHRQTPEWIFQDSDGNPASRELVLSRLRTHIREVMHRYRGRIDGWDVVNEALSDLPSEFLRDSPWRRAIGDDYVLRTFQFAREADPEARLYYNDYGLESPVKREKMIRLVKELQAAGAAPDAVNVQGHYSLHFPPSAAIEHTLQAIADLGLRANISELDVSLFHYWKRDNPYPNGAPEAVLELQGRRYGELFALFLRHRDKIDRVTFWNLHDGLSWLNNEPVIGRPDYPLLFCREGNPKPAYFAVVEAGRD